MLVILLPRSLIIIITIIIIKQLIICHVQTDIIAGLQCPGFLAEKTWHVGEMSITDLLIHLCTDTALRQHSLLH